MFLDGAPPVAYIHSLAGLAFGIIVAWRLAPAGNTGELTMYVFSVGHGQACAIRLPDGRLIIYDIGSLPPYDLV